jgi:hypothetical protein
MNQQQRKGSLQDLAAVIAKRITSIRQLHAEKGAQPPAGEIAKRFKILCDAAQLQDGPPSTCEMEILATALVPKAIEQYLARYERMAA